MLKTSDPFSLDMFDRVTMDRVLQEEPISTEVSQWEERLKPVRDKSTILEYVNSSFDLIEDESKRPEKITSLKNKYLFQKEEIQKERSILVPNPTDSQPYFPVLLTPKQKRAYS